MSMPMRFFELHDCGRKICFATHAFATHDTLRTTCHRMVTQANK
jgi:hypothetical protein